VALVRKRTIPTERPPLVRATDPTAVNLDSLDPSRYFFTQVAPQLSSRGWADPVTHPLLIRKSGSAGNRTQTSGSVARNSDHYTTCIEFATLSGHYVTYSVSDTSSPEHTLFWLIRKPYSYTYRTRVSVCSTFPCFLLVGMLSTLKNEAVYSSETSLNVYQIIRAYIPEGNTLQCHRRDNFKLKQCQFKLKVRM
jgi:hypothetical protein